MKSFKSFVKEDSGFPTWPVGENPNNLGGSLEVNPSEVGNPDVLRRLNAIVGAIGNHEYLVAENAIERLRATLTKIGLSYYKANNFPILESLTTIIIILILYTIISPKKVYGNIPYSLIIALYLPVAILSMHFIISSKGIK